MDYRLTLPPGPWGTILADPPWQLRTGGGRRRLHYDTMTLDELKKMPVGSIAAPDAHLWLWATNPHLPEALELVAAWGFRYKSLATWNKRRMGLGWWLRSQTEHLILAVRSNKARREPGSWTTYFEGGWKAHSVKPDSLYIPMIEALSPPPRLELFARQMREGWTCLVSDAPPAGDPYGREGEKLGEGGDGLGDIVADMGRAHSSLDGGSPVGGAHDNIRASLTPTACHAGSRRLALERRRSHD